MMKVVRYLHEANPFLKDYKTFLLSLRPSRLIVQTLIVALGNQESREYAEQVLIGYGPRILRFIRPPGPATSLYDSLTAVINVLQAQK